MALGLDMFSKVPIIGGLGGLAGGYLSTPNTYDAQKELEDAKKKAGDVYTQAGNQAQWMAEHPAPGMGDEAVITPDMVTAPERLAAERVDTPDAITAQTIGTPSGLSGPEADALKTKQLEAASAIAGGPSAAAATMKSGLTAASQQMLGQAARARGASRAAAARDAMLGTGEMGMKATQDAAALAASEEIAKRKAASDALSGIRAGDISAAGALTEVGKANQGADIERQRLTAANKLAAQTQNQQAGLEAGKANVASKLQQESTNQAAGLTGQTATFGNKLAGWQAQTGGQRSALDTQLQSVGAGTQAAGVAANYATGQTEAKLKNKEQNSQLLAGGLSAIGLSDEQTKLDISPIAADRYKGALTSGLTLTQPTVQMPESKGQDFLAWDPGKKQIEDDKGESGSYKLGKALGTGLSMLGGLSDEDTKEYINKMMISAESPSARRRAAKEEAARSRSKGDEIVAKQAEDQELAYMQNNTAWTDNPGFGLSDERAKRQVDRMGPDDVIDFAERFPLATFRYKPGIDAAPDDGERFHVGGLAREVESLGPMGKLLVDEGPDGYKRIEYGPAALAVGKGALAKADKAMEIAMEAIKLARARKGG